jgi:putative DNA modification/repair radical SAM protein
MVRTAAGENIVDALQKIQTLGESAQYDLACACGGTGRIRGPLDRWIYPSVLPDGGRTFLFKVLLSNACTNNCHYCVNRAEHHFQRTSFGAEELARIFLQLCARQKVGGLFLSSGVLGSSDATMERMIRVAEILRIKHRFRGYIHLKILPGASFDLVERAVQLATRVSVNLEAPNQDRLSRIAEGKSFQRDLVQRMKWARDIIRSQHSGTSRSQTTQFVVGAAGESDREILVQTDCLYRQMNLARVYFSAFQPITGTPLQDRSATPPLREHRLYQADFLLRRYGFRFGDLVFDDSGDLPESADPKTVWARSHPEFFPLEVNQAEQNQLLRVPGIGPLSARRIVHKRARGRFHSLGELKGLGVWTRRAAPFLLINGRLRGSLQLGLFEESAREPAPSTPAPQLIPMP